MRTVPLLVGTLILAGTAAAQQPRPGTRVTVAPTPRAYSAWSSNGDDDTRAVLGISTTSSGERDTLGLLVNSVTSGSPAEKAGLEEGNRIVAINGANLKLATVDAGEQDMQGLMSRRLEREMRKVKAGDEVELKLYVGGQAKSVRVKTIAAEDLPGRSARLTTAERRDAQENRAVVGLNLNASGSRRDTLGALVVSVAQDGPAEKAGIYEGDRVAAVNGVSLRVAKDDAGDPMVANAKVSRFRREMEKVKPGDDVQLIVVSGGQSRTVRVKASTAKDTYKNERGTHFYFGNMGETGFMMPPMPPMPAMPVMPAMPPMPPMPAFGGQHFDFDSDSESEMDDAPMVIHLPPRGEIESRVRAKIAPVLMRLRERSIV